MTTEKNAPKRGDKVEILIETSFGTIALKGRFTTIEPKSTFKPGIFKFPSMPALDLKRPGPEVTVDINTDTQAAANKITEAITNMGHNMQAMQIDALAAEIHNTAKEKGWWDEYPAKIEAMSRITSFVDKELGNMLSPHHANAINDQVELVLNDLWPKRNVGELMMLIVTEIAEAYETYRSGDFDREWTEDGTEDGKPEGGRIELGDAVIRILDTMYERGWKPGQVIRKKMNYNKTREYRHGGKLS